MATDPISLHDEVALDDPHVYMQRTKIVRSGQVRTYYAAGCGCGWAAPKFRVTDERAVTDWWEHATACDERGGE
jgi:hypothetical protein